MTKELLKIILGTIIIIFVVVSFLSTPTVSSAQEPNQASEDYTLLAPIPCVGTDRSCAGQATKTNLETYLPGIFNLAIGISAAFAVLNLVWGGFQYLSSDAIMKKSEGKNRLSHSITGLVLVIAAWLILYTINPKLLVNTLSLETVVVRAPYGAEGTILYTGEGKPLNAQELVADKEIRDFLESSANIKVYADPCQGTQTKNCVNLNGLPNSAQVGLKNLSFDCPSCTITITGATEGGHATHGEGKPIVDLRSNNTQLNNYITNDNNPMRQTSLGPEYTVTIGGQKATFLRESNPPHWHVVFQ